MSEHKLPPDVLKRVLLMALIGTLCGIFYFMY